jgi:hypothetical protein
MGKWNRLGSDDAVGTGPNPPEGQEVGAAHGGASPCPGRLTEEMIGMIRATRIATDFATELLGIGWHLPG